MTAMDSNFEEFPKIIQDYWYSIDWDVEAIWRLNLPTEEFPFRELAWHLDAPVWPDGEKRYCVTPRQVLDEPQRFKAEADRIENASLEYPIDVFFNRDRWMILDGVHRLAKAWRQTAKKVRVRRVPNDAVRQLDLIAGPQP